MPDLNDYYAYRKASAGSGGNGGGGNLGCGGIIIIVALILLFLGMVDARLEEIGKLLGLGCLAFLVIRWVFS